jgi:hypothetical protein
MGVVFAFAAKVLLVKVVKLTDEGCGAGCARLRGGATDGIAEAKGLDPVEPGCGKLMALSSAPARP